jgi:hypothetical protein
LVDRTRNLIPNFSTASSHRSNFARSPDEPYIANRDAGTYAQLVETAESCQVSIIHPGKPRNPAEPNLPELLKRAEAFV